MQKDSTNHVGFSYNNGEIKAIVKDSSAARYAREKEGGRRGREREKRGGEGECVYLCAKTTFIVFRFMSYVAKIIRLNFPYL